MTTSTSGVLARFPLLLPVRNSFASYGASAVTRTSDRGHVAEVRNQGLEYSGTWGRIIKPESQYPNTQHHHCMQHTIAPAPPTCNVHILQGKHRRGGVYSVGRWFGEFGGFVLPDYTVNSPPNHSLALSHPSCIVCIVGVRERGIAPFLASVTDNCFKPVCQMTWIYSITQPHTDVHRIHISSSSHTSGK